MHKAHNIMTDVLDVSRLPPATVVSVHRRLYRHFGLLTEAGVGRERCVLSFNPGPQGLQLRTETLASFCRGKTPTFELQPSDLPAAVVLARARSGSHPTYSWPHFNCEHFVRFALGLPAESPQVRAVAAIAAVVGMVFALKRQA